MKLVAEAAMGKDNQREAVSLATMGKAKVDYVASVLLVLRGNRLPRAARLLDCDTLKFHH
jgi:hypothetical protein